MCHQRPIAEHPNPSRVVGHLLEGLPNRLARAELGYLISPPSVGLACFRARPQDAFEWNRRV